MGGDVLMNWVSIVFVFLVGVGIFVEDRYGSLNFCFFGLDLLIFGFGVFCLCGFMVVLLSIVVFFGNLVILNIFYNKNVSY